jgi:hypothetical protein
MAQRGKTSGVQPGPEPAPSLPYPGGEADAFIRDLLERIDDSMRRARPTMGTVLSVLDGPPVVKVDDEKAPRTISFSRALGEEYRVGDRVKLSLLRNDEYVIDGIYSNAVTDRRVGRLQIASGAVTGNEIDQQGNGVWWENLSQYVRNQITTVRKWVIDSDDIAPGAITNSKLGNKSVSGSKVADKTIGWQQIYDGAIYEFNLNHNSITDWLDGRYRRL